MCDVFACAMQRVRKIRRDIAWGLAQTAAFPFQSICGFSLVFEYYIIIYEYMQRGARHS